jgi:hypothetical protein
MRMRRSFTGPFWVLLIFGLLLVLLISAVLRIFPIGGLYSSGRTAGPGLNILRIFMWPVIYLVEALVYWLIRRRNSFQALSWAHTVIFILAFLLNGFFTAIQIMRYRLDPVAEGRINRHILMHQQQYLFWGLVILAHLAFIAVLANCFRKPEPVDGGESEGNILDDVVL